MKSQELHKKYGFIQLEQDAFLEVDTNQTYVITNTKTLNSLYSKINRTRKPGILVPDIDFNTHAILVAQSSKPNATGNIFLTIFKETEDAIQIEVTMEETENQSIAYPFCIYRLNKTVKNIQFIQK